MYKFLMCILAGHRWEFLREIRVFHRSTDQMPSHYDRIYECQRCSRIKKKRL